MLTAPQTPTAPPKHRMPPISDTILTKESLVHTHSSGLPDSKSNPVPDHLSIFGGSMLYNFGERTVVSYQRACLTPLWIKEGTSSKLLSCEKACGKIKQTWGVQPSSDIPTEGWPRCGGQHKLISESPEPPILTTETTVLKQPEGTLAENMLLVVFCQLLLLLSPNKHSASESCCYWGCRARVGPNKSLSHPRSPSSKSPLLRRHSQLCELSCLTIPGEQVLSLKRTIARHV